MKKLALVLSVLFLLNLTSKTQAQENRSDVMNETITSFLQYVSADSIQHHMQSLEDFGTRFCLANNRKVVALWIKNKFISLGYPDTQLDSFQLNRWYNGVYYQTWQYNVVANYEGYLNPDQVYVMGGHYDAIVPFSSNPFVIAPGADDNASGVAAAIEVARIMKQYNYMPESTIKFIAFAAEELGLHGAWHYANNAASQNMNIVFMLNNDMISYCTLPPLQWTLRIQKYPNSQTVTNLAAYIAQAFTILSVTEATQYIQNSDSWPFYSNGYKAIFLQENQFTPFYHTVNDLVIHSNMPYTAEMVKVSLGMLIHENGPGSIAGSSCNNPLLATLPLLNYEGSTELLGNNFHPSWLVTEPPYAANYVGGNDMVFEFSLNENSLMNGSITCPEGNNAGLFILGVCPVNEFPVNVLQFAGGSAGGSFEQLPLPAGTYYAIVSSWPEPEFTTFTLNLSAQAAPQQPTLAIIPEEVNFGIITLGSQSTGQQLMLKNHGSELLSITGVSLSGSNADQFLILNQPGTFPLLLQFGETAAATLAFSPTQAGLQSANFTVTTNIPSTQNIPLSGHGYGGAVIALPYAQDFTGLVPGQIPDDWMQDNANWEVVNSNYAGGEAPELGFSGTSSTNGLHRLIMNPVNAAGASELELSFKHMLDDNPDNQNAFSLKLQSSVDGGINWDDQWAVAPASTIPSETVFVDLNTLSGDMFWLSWAYEGQPASVNAWYIDNIVISAVTSPFLAGDANCDGSVDVLDVVSIINFILENNPTPFCFDNADVNLDGTVNVLDVVGTVNIIIGTKNASRLAIKSGPAQISLYSDHIELISDGTLAGLQFEIKGDYLDYMNLDFELSGFEFGYSINDGKLRGIVFSFDNKLLPVGKVRLLSYSGYQSGLEWGDVVAANLKAENVPVTKHIEKIMAGLNAEDYTLLAYPNPARGEFTIETGIPHQSMVVIRILDMVGKEVLKLHEGILSQGDHLYKVEPGQRLKPGFYLLHITAIPETSNETIITKNLKLIVQ